MSALRTLQQTFAGVLIDGAPALALEKLVRADDRASAEERVAVYASMYRLRLIEVLGEVYPLTRVLVGEDAFDDIANAYVRAHPSRSPSLRAYGASFDAFLAKVADAHAHAAALARLEWARYDVFDAIDEPVLKREKLAVLAPEAIAEVHLRTIRASQIVACTHDVDGLYRALKEHPEDKPPDAPATPTTLLVWRDPPTIFHRPIGAREARMLALLSEGTSLGLLCEAMADGEEISVAAAEVFGLVGRWIADGLLSDARPGPATSTGSATGC